MSDDAKRKLLEHYAREISMSSYRSTAGQEGTK